MTDEGRQVTVRYAPTDVDTAILSHLHEDHIGGLSELRGADLLVAATEREQLSELSPAARELKPASAKITNSSRLGI